MKLNSLQELDPLNFRLERVETRAHESDIGKPVTETRYVLEGPYDPVKPSSPPEPLEAGWVEWHGGKDCPFASHVLAEIKDESGVHRTRDLADSLYQTNWTWLRSSGEPIPAHARIIAYRVLP